MLGILSQPNGKIGFNFWVETDAGYLAASIRWVDVVTWDVLKSILDPSYILDPSKKVDEQ